MKRFAVLFACVVCFAGSNLNAQQLKWFHSIGWYPLTMKNEATGEIYGTSSDIMNELAKKLNTTASFQDVPWKRGFEMLDKGELDICAGAYENAERKERFLFTKALFNNETRIFVNNKKVFRFDNLNDLKGKRLGRTLGASYGTEFDTFAKDNIALTNIKTGKEQLTQMLMMNRIDGFIMDNYDCLHYLRINKLDKKIVPLKKPINTVEIYFMVSKQSPWAKKIDQIDQAIQSLIDSGKMARILDKY